MSSAAATTRVLVSDRCCLPATSRTSLVPGVIRIALTTGRITSIEVGAEAVTAARAAAPSAEIILLDAGNDVIMSGLVDTHVHCNEPGRTNWEGLETATKAAAAGGVTTIVDMPLNSIPPTTTLEGLLAKEAAAVGKLSVDLGLWGGIIPTNLNDLKELAEGGVCGFKCFMCESGVDEFPCVSPDELRAAMNEVVASCPTLPVLCHAEQCSHVHVEACAPEHHNSWLHSRPTTFETDAISTALRLAEETGARTHVVHLSAADGVPLFAEARAKGLSNISVETCPHYLTLDAESIPSGATAFKCAPPIRGKANQAALWDALRAGTIPMIVSDHSPCEPSLKVLETGDFSKAWGGISSLQLGLPLIFSELRAQALVADEASALTPEVLGATIVQLNQWMSVAPSAFVHFSHRKGALAVGMDGDVTIWNPEQPFLVEKAMIQHRHKLTPYLGRTLYGQVTRTFLRGQQVYHNAGDHMPVEFAPIPLGQRVRPAEHPLEKRD